MVRVSRRISLHFVRVCEFHHQNKKRWKNNMNNYNSSNNNSPQTLSDIFFLFPLASILVLSSSSHHCFTMFVQPKDVYRLINFMSTRLHTREWHSVCISRSNLYPFFCIWNAFSDPMCNGVPFKIWLCWKHQFHDKQVPTQWNSI